MAARTQGAITLGPSGNSQGGQKFYTLTTCKVAVRKAWTELPTPNSVIKRVHLLAKGIPSLPVFTDRTGCIIGDVINKEIYENNEVPALVDNGDLPGVHTDKTEGIDEIPGVVLHQRRQKILISTLLQPMKAMSNHHCLTHHH